MVELTKLQETILSAAEPRIAVEASAASGKTRLLTEKVRQLLRSGVPPTSIAVITFTRLAAQELIDRLGEDYKDGIFIGTIHSLAAHFLVLNGLGAHISKVAEEEQFDKLFDLCQGLNLYHSYDWICLDEAQDCGEKELDFIFDLIDPVHYFVALDYRQSIYGFRGARPDILHDYLDHNNTVYYSLNENFRNGSNILTYAKAILKPIKMKDDSIPMRGVEGHVNSVSYTPKNLIQNIKSIGEYKDWAILCRTNDSVERIMSDLEDNDIPCVTFKQGDLNKSKLEKIMASNTVKVLTAHSSKGLEWDNVATYKLWWRGAEERRLNYVAATRARNLLIMYK